MKKEALAIGTLLLYLYSSIIIAQNTGDLAFTSFNTDGDDDFSIVVLTDTPANTIIYFTDDESDGSGGLSGSEGVITWNTGPSAIKAGTSIVFTDVDNGSNTNFGASIGTITRSGSFSLSGSKDGLIAYLGSDLNTPTLFLAAIQIGNDSTNLGPFDGDGITLTNTGLAIGTTIIVIDNVASPDGGKYIGSRSNQTTFSNYLTQLTDENTNWTTVSSTGDGETLLPFSEESFTIKTTNWTGDINNQWNFTGNWDNGIPSSSSLATIPNVINPPIISSGTEATAGNLIIANESLTINQSNSLTIHGILTVNGELTINSGGSIIVKGTSTGNLSYSRTLTSNWHLISSPVDQQDIHTFTVTDIATNSIATSGANYGISTYDNNSSVWNYYTTGTIATAGNFIAGKGYAALRTSGGNVTFTGTISTNNVTIAITDGSANEWNLIGNPYPSYISANLDADATNNFITINTANLNASYQAIYVWNGSSYEVINHISSSRFIAPGQGFFVNSITSGAHINFTEAMQSHQEIDVFSKSKSTKPEIDILMSDKSSVKKTEIKYFPGATTGLDPGYDAGMFSGLSNSFSIYTHLVTDSDGTNFALQALPNNDYENIVIPIGFNSVSGKELTFSITHKHLPTGMMVFLEDRKENKIIRLDELNTNYKIFLSNENKGIGRFYLRTSITDLRKVLNTMDNELNLVDIYLTSNRNLRITGLRNDNANLKIHDVLGRRIVDKQLQSSSIIDVSLPTSAKQGIYLIKIETENGTLIKKIFLY